MVRQTKELKQARLSRFETIFGSPGVVLAVIGLVTLYNLCFKGFPYNYLTFLSGFDNLRAGSDLYQHVPSLDYKYSPTFAVLIAPFSLVRGVAGAFLWNIMIGLVFIWGVMGLKLNPLQRATIFCVCIPELASNCHNFQTNTLQVGLMLLFLKYFRESAPWKMALTISLLFFIKVYGVVVALLLLTRRQHWSVWLKMAGVGLILFLTPLLFVSLSELFQLYESWLRLIQRDSNVFLGLSFFGLWNAVFGWPLPKTPIALGTVGIMAFYFWSMGQRKSSKQDSPEDLLLMGWILLWVSSFNHMFESATAIIGAMGIAVWLLYQNRPFWLHWVFWAKMGFMTLSNSDLFPKAIRDHYGYGYSMKVWVAIGLWFYLTWVFMVSKRPQAWLRRRVPFLKTSPSS